MPYSLYIGKIGLESVSALVENKRLHRQVGIYKSLVGKNIKANIYLVLVFIFIWYLYILKA